MIPLGVLASAYVAPAGGGGGNYYDEAMADSPLIYLRLDDTTGPPANDGSLSASISAATSYPTFGATGLGDGATSADFPASTSVGIGLGNLDTYIGPTGAATFEAIINVDSLAATRVILSRTAASSATGRFQVSSDGTLRYLGGTTWATSIQSTGTLATGTTYHVAVTLTGTSGILYINGSADGSGSVTTYVPSYLDWSLGRSLQNSYQYPFDGKIAGFAMYDTTLTAARILAHAQAAGVA